MWKLIVLLSIVSCNSGENIQTLFESSTKNGCVFVSDVRINSVNIGDFAVCTIHEYKKRIKND